MKSTFSIFFHREWLLIKKNNAIFVQTLGFFVLIGLLFPLSQNVETTLLSQIGGGVIWVSAVLASLLSLENLFYSDYHDGCIEQWLLQPRSLPVAMFAKVCAHWSASGLILTLFSPILALAFKLSFSKIIWLCIGLFVGTPSLILIGAIGAALTVTLPKGGVLLALIILPLYIPILIFGAGMLANLATEAQIYSGFYALLTLFFLTVTLAPFAIASALKHTFQ